MPTIFETGPYLIVAALCEKSLQEADGVISLIRVVDKVTQTFVGGADQVPQQMPELPVSLTLAIFLRGGEARGRYSLKVQAEEPSGVKKPANELPINFTGQPNGGANLVIGFNMVAEQEGLYWIDVSLDDNLLTRIPLQVDYQPLRRPQETP